MAYASVNPFDGKTLKTFTELTDAQLDEIPLLMLFYAGAGNTTALHQGISTAKAKAKEKPG